MDDDYEDSLKIAALNKLKKVNHLINEVTIGPHSLKTLNINPSANPLEQKSSEPKNADSNKQNADYQIPTRQFIKFLDLERQEKVYTALTERLNLFDKFNKLQEQQSKMCWLKKQQAFIEDMEKQEKKIVQANEQYDLKQSSQHAKLAQLTQNAVQRMKQREELLQEKEKQRQQIYDNINKIKSNQQKFSLEYQQILGILKSCTDHESLKSLSGMDFSLLKTLPSEIDVVLEKCKGENIINISQADVEKSVEVVSKLIDFKIKFKTIVDDINKKKQEMQILEERTKTAPEPSNVPVIPPPTSSDSTANTNCEKSNSSEATVESSNSEEVANINKVSKYVSITNLKTYTELMDFLEKYRQNFKQLEDDITFKTFKFDCKKAVNIPVNALSGVNSDHILDKYTKLNRLLSGQSIIISDKEVNASRHPQGIAFCTDLLARKFVLQGDLMVSSSPESAFCYASVILSLWNDFPDFGKLILAYFYKTCPYLVPYNIPRQVGQSDEEFYMRQGYQYNNGEVEKQDKFLKRMTGISRLYFSLLIAKPKRGHKSSPHNLKYGWKWLSSFLRLDPQIDITATLLHVFLETVGFEMEASYGKVFQRVLSSIIQVFLPKCKEVRCTGGAATRLELLLSNYIKNRKFDKPQGYVEYAYW